MPPRLMLTPLAWIFPSNDKPIAMDQMSFFGPDAANIEENFVWIRRQNPDRSGPVVSFRIVQRQQMGNWASVHSIDGPQLQLAHPARNARMRIGCEIRHSNLEMAVWLYGYPVG